MFKRDATQKVDHTSVYFTHTEPKVGVVVADLLLTTHNLSASKACEI